MMIWRESRLSPICPACPACPASPASPASAGGPFYIESSYNVVRMLNLEVREESVVLLVLRREKQRECHKDVRVLDASKLNIHSRTSP